MTQPFDDPVLVDDIHLIMTLTVLGEQRGVAAEWAPVYETWRAAYPKDALGPLGVGLCLLRDGEMEEGLALIEREALTAETRADQAAEVYETLQAELVAAAE